MSETIKQALARCRGDVFVLLHPGYSRAVPALRMKVSKPEARRVIDFASRDKQPLAFWQGADLILNPNCPDRP